jgi:hypothetical protein
MGVSYEAVFEFDVDCDECRKDIDAGYTDMGDGTNFNGCKHCGYVLCDKCEAKHYDAVDEEFHKDEIKFFRVCADADKDGKCSCDSIHRGYVLHTVVVKGIDRFNKEISRCPKCGEEDSWDELSIYDLIRACKNAERERLEDKRAVIGY